jgi:hypothetical protein
MGRVTAIADPLVARRSRRRARVQADRHADRLHRAPLVSYVLRGDILTILTAPVIYSLIVPFVIVDLWVSLYQALCFAPGMWRASTGVNSLTSIGRSWDT